MSTKRRKARNQKRATDSAVAKQPSQARLIAVGALAVPLLLFYWTPLTSSNLSIHWDAVDVHYSAQKYFADEVHSGRLPHWTPHIFSGFPFLADPQTGAWYPLNWPFFAAGVTPKGIQLQLVLHCLLALFGMYLLAREYFPRREVAVVAAMAYGFSGYFADHASHVGMFAAAAWLPWVLWTLRQAIVRSTFPWAVLAGAEMGLVGLIGHFQNALYVGLAAVLYALAMVAEDRQRWKRAAVTLGLAGGIAVLLAAVVIVPGLELAGQSIRAGMGFANRTDLVLEPRSLLTLVYANALGAIEGYSEASSGITPHYLYGGVLLLPLVVLGLRRSSLLWHSLALVVPALWYALGPDAGFYRLVAWLPGLANVRGPAHAWFVVQLGLALLVGAGFSELLRRKDVQYLALGIPLILFADVFWWNSVRNPLAYQRASFEDTYVAGVRLFEARVGRELPTLERFHAPYPLPAFGPLNHPLDARVESTYGYNPLELARYRAYFEAAKVNPRLLEELGASRRMDMTNGMVLQAEAMPRVYFPPKVESVSDAATSEDRLRTLIPEEAAIVEGASVATQDARGTAQILTHEEGSYRVRYQVSSESLLRVAVPYYPGWHAEVEGIPIRIFPADHALIGIVVPEGEHELLLEFRTQHFRLSAVVSLLAALAVVAFCILRRRDLRINDSWAARPR